MILLFAEIATNPLLTFVLSQGGISVIAYILYMRYKAKSDTHDESQERRIDELQKSNNKKDEQILNLTVDSIKAISAASTSLEKVLNDNMKDNNTELLAAVQVLSKNIDLRMVELRELLEHQRLQHAK